MGQALYRKYRSKSFDEVVGQRHITETLRKGLKNGRLSHAYLFTGPRGVGKTSVARILAREVNNLDYKDDSIHLDIIEIDAASNNGVEDVRELREKVHVSPVSAKYKVYIIDEVHMLSKAAFNALLKTLEEPPAHVIFILATTEAHKVPDTIVSRTQRFEFKPIDAASASEHLKEIAKAEGINLDDAAAKLLAEHANGSFRDSISLLDQLSADGEAITEADVRSFLGIPSSEAIANLVSAIAQGNQGSVLENLDELGSQGVATNLIASSLAAKLRQQLLTNFDQPGIAPLLRSLFEIPASADPSALLEICLLESAAARTPITPSRPTRPDSDAPAIDPPPIKTPAKPTEKTDKFDEQSWQKILEAVKADTASLYTALRLATPRLENKELILSFEFPLHQKKIDRASAKDLIAKKVAEVTGKDLTIKTTVEKNTVQEKSEPVAQTLSNIFGATEVLES